MVSKIQLYPWHSFLSKQKIHIEKSIACKLWHIFNLYYLLNLNNFWNLAVSGNLHILLDQHFNIFLTPYNSFLKEFLVLHIGAFLGYISTIVMARINTTH